MKAKPMTWVVGDYKLNGKLRRNVVMKRTSRKNRYGFTVYYYHVQDNRRDWRGEKMSGFVPVKPLKFTKPFKTRDGARAKRSAMEAKK